MIAAAGATDANAICGTMDMDAVGGKTGAGAVGGSGIWGAKDSNAIEGKTGALDTIGA